MRVKACLSSNLGDPVTPLTEHFGALFLFFKLKQKFVVHLQQSLLSPYLLTILSSLSLLPDLAMKKLLQGAVLPFTLFAFIAALIGCDPTFQQPNQDQATEQQTESRPTDSATETRATSDHLNESKQNDNAVAKQNTATVELKSGNVFYIARDVADLQMQAGQYLEEIESTQTDLQQAINLKDQQQAQTAVTHLKNQLQGFNRTLSALDLKSQEISKVRQHLLNANQQVLDSALMNGQIDFNQIDLKKIQTQIGSIESEMLKLATMVYPEAESAEH